MDKEYEALVKEALEKLEHKYKELPVRPTEQKIIETIRWADDGQLDRVLEVLEDG